MRLEGRNSYYGMGTDLIHTFDSHQMSCAQPSCRT